MTKAGYSPTVLFLAANDCTEAKPILHLWIIVLCSSIKLEFYGSVNRSINLAQSWPDTNFESFITIWFILAEAMTDYLSMSTNSETDSDKTLKLAIFC